MPGETLTQSAETGKIFLHIKEGSFRQKAEEGAPGAIKREYVNPQTNEKGCSYEYAFKSWEGKIQSVGIKELDFGRILEIDMGDAIISIPVDKPYFTDIASKLPAVDMTKEVILSPYNFEADGKRRTGVTVMQGKDKIKSYFYDGKKNLHGMPSMEAENPDSDDWKMYFMGVRKFLIKYIQEEMGNGFVEDKEATVEDLPF